MNFECGKTLLGLVGGFGSYLLSMDERTYKLIGVDYPGNRAEDVKNPGLLWMIGFLSVVSFLGLFSLAPLRKVFTTLYGSCYIAKITNTNFRYELKMEILVTAFLRVLGKEISFSDCVLFPLNLISSFKVILQLLFPHSGNLCAAKRKCASQ